MAELALAGKGGSVYLPGTPNAPITEVNTWTLTIDADNYDVSVLGDSWKHFIPGLRGWNGSIHGFYNLVNDTAGQFAVYNALLAGSQLVIQMQTAAGGGYWEGTCNVTQIAVSDPVNNAITLDFTFVGSGSIQHLP